MTSIASATESAIEALEAIRARAPRVHCITNDAAQVLSANVLLAIGAQPSLTSNPAEAPAFVAGSDALLINLGTLDDQRMRGIEAAVDMAVRQAVPFVLDPVLINRSPRRADFAAELLKSGPSIVRGNALEMDTIFARQEVKTLSDAARDLGMILARTGKRDELSAGEGVIAVENGAPVMTRLTAMGCAQGAVMAAFMAVEADPLTAALAALIVFGVAGELAAQRAGGPGSFQPLFLDALYTLDRPALRKMARAGPS